MDDLYDLCADILLIAWYRDAEIPLPVHGDGRFDSLQDFLFGNAGQDEISGFHRFRALGGGPDTDRRERLADGVIKAALFRQRPGIGDHAEGVPLQLVVIMESQRLVDPHSRVDWEFSRLQRLAAARMARIQHRQIVDLRQPIDGCEQLDKIVFVIDIFFAVRRKQQILLRRKC